MMKKYDKLKLWEVCLYKPLFRKELENLVGQTEQHDLFDVLKYCYDKYSDMHPEILLDVFSSYGENGKRSNMPGVEKNEAAEMWN